MAKKEKARAESSAREYSPSRKQWAPGDLVAWKKAQCEQKEGAKTENAPETTAGKAEPTTKQPYENERIRNNSAHALIPPPPLLRANLLS